MGHLWLNGWGTYDFNGWGIYGLDECGSYGNLAVFEICSKIAGLPGSTLSRY